MDDISTTAGESTQPTKPTQGLLVENQFELYRLRSEYFERNFYSLRLIEFQLAFQIYAAYAAIGGAFFALTYGYKAILSTWLVLGTTVLLLLVFALGFICQWQILRRLHFSQHMQNRYIDYLHENIPELEPGESKKIIFQIRWPFVRRQYVLEKRPGFRKWWAFAPMLVVNVSVLASLLAAIWLAK